MYIRAVLIDALKRCLKSKKSRMWLGDISYKLFVSLLFLELSVLVYINPKDM